MKTRDLTITQYLAALHRNGFALEKGVFAGYVKHSDLPSISFGPIVSSNDGRILRRESLSRFIQCRDKELARKEAA